MGLFGARVRKTRHKNSEFLYGALQVSDIPLLRQGVAALNATPPGQRHTTQVPRWLPSSAEGRTRIVLLAGAPVAEEDRRFISEVDPPSGPHAARP